MNESFRIRFENIPVRPIGFRKEGGPYPFGGTIPEFMNITGHGYVEGHLEIEQLERDKPVLVWLVLEDDTRIKIDHADVSMTRSEHRQS